MCAESLQERNVDVECDAEVPPYVSFYEINWLNDHCLWHIFSQLPFDAKIAASQVCRRWESIIFDLCGKLKATKINVYFRCTHETYFYDQLNNGLELIAPNIEKMYFNMDVVDSFFKSMFVSIGINCINLKIVHFDFVEMNSDRLLSLCSECPQIKDLTFSNCRGLTDKSLRCIFSQERSGIEAFSFICSDEFDGKCLQFIRLSLKRLSFSACQKMRRDYFVAGIQRLKDTLTCLTLEDCPKIYDCNWNYISKLVPKLQTLNLRGISDEIFFAHILEINNFKELQRLDLSNNICVNDILITSIVNNCTELKVLKLCIFNHLSYITEKCITELGKLKHLEELNLNDNHVVSDKSLKGFSDLSSPSKLKKLICSYCRFGDQGAIKILSSCLDLEFFDLSFSKITTATVKEAVEFLRKRESNLPLTLNLFGVKCLTSVLENDEFKHPYLNVINICKGEKPPKSVDLTCNCEDPYNDFDFDSEPSF